MLKLKYVTPVLLGALAFLGAVSPVSTRQAQAAPAQTGLREEKTIPLLLGLSTGERIATHGLAKGEMKFLEVSGTRIGMHQAITLNPLARRFMEMAMEKKLSSPSNTVILKFEVIRQPNQSFIYRLFDQGNQELLLEGPIRVLKDTRNTATHQRLVFQAVLVGMEVTIDKSAAADVTGNAIFYVGPVRVPGSMGFRKLP